MEHSDTGPAGHQNDTHLPRISGFFKGFTLKPAQTILLSFLFVIAAGTALLMLPIATVASGSLHLIDALFTSTSAVCVTGLIVVDTAHAYTLWGKIIILVLIQVGGLGIMILSYFAVFTARRRVSIEEKLMLSYMLSEDNVNLLSRRIRSIIYATFGIETAGALLLLPAFLDSGITNALSEPLAGALTPAEAASQTGGSLFTAVFYSVFHAISAFCNAGFALFTDSLESFQGNLLVNGTVALLIITGGISFSVIVELVSELKERGRGKLSLNSKVVLSGTGILIVLGMLLFYIAEHGETLAELPTGRQYLAAFFQSVTLRTAGFNTVPIGSLAGGTLLIMMVFMFIGAAQGSTAGGIKINTVAVMYSYITSVLSGRRDVVLSRYSIAPEQVQKAFLVLLFGILSVGAGSILLSFTESMPFEALLFETVSAFGTVGLSTGITSSLSWSGKIVIVVLMFFGRLGPLTILAAAAEPEKGISISYPRGNISI